MNYRRGLFRLWIVAGAIWVLVWIAIGWNMMPVWENKIYDPAIHGMLEDIETGERIFQSEEEIARARADRIAEDRRIWKARTEYMRRFAAIALLPPMAILLIGGAFAWAFAGFSSRK